jgi:hypothetical protein
MSKLKNIATILGTALSVFLVSFIVLVWAGPGEGEDPPVMDSIPTPLNVGSDPQTKDGALSIGGVLEVDGGMIINSGGSTTPTCNSTNRGLIYFTQGTEDELKFCMKTEEETYEWRSF